MEKRADVDAISNQIVKINDFVDININFLADRSNYLLKRKVIVKKIYNNRESYSLNENDKHLIWFKYFQGVSKPNALTDTNEDSSSIFTINIPNYNNLSFGCPSQPYSLTSLNKII